MVVKWIHVNALDTELKYLWFTGWGIFDGDKDLPEQGWSETIQVYAKWKYTFQHLHVKS